MYYIIAFETICSTLATIRAVETVIEDVYCSARATELSFSVETPS
jgi:hypothetical protein